MTEKPSLTVESDASTQGWGASCEGIPTGGHWSSEEKQWHINCLEAQNLCSQYTVHATRFEGMDNLCLRSEKRR